MALWDDTAKTCIRRRGRFLHQQEAQAALYQRHMSSSQRLKNVRRWRFNSRNVVIFDETVIGDSVTVPFVIGERRKSGGDSNNFVHTRQARLGCFIPFSMLDGATPLPRFYLQARGCSKRWNSFPCVGPKARERVSWWSIQALPFKWNRLP